jgi:hypothetical protein
MGLVVLYMIEVRWEDCKQAVGRETRPTGGLSWRKFGIAAQMLSSYRRDPGPTCPVHMHPQSSDKRIGTFRLSRHLIHHLQLKRKIS